MANNSTNQGFPVMTTPAGRLLTAEDKTMKIGFVGLGIMGSRMAANLRKHGYALVVFNRTRAKAAPLLQQDRKSVV